MSSHLMSMVLAIPHRHRVAAATALGLIGVLMAVRLVSSIQGLEPAHLHTLYGVGLTGLISVWAHSAHGQFKRHADRLDAESRWRGVLSGLDDAIIVVAVDTGPPGNAANTGSAQGSPRTASWLANASRASAPPPHRILHLNPAAGRLCGQIGPLAPGAALQDAFPKTAWPALHLALDEVRQRGGSACAPWQTSLEHEDSQGSCLRFWQLTVIPQTDSVTLCLRDVTEAKRALDAVHEREAFYRTLVDNLPLAVSARSARPRTAGQYVVWNQAAADVLQLPAELVLGRTASERMPADIVRLTDTLDMQVVREPRVHRFSDVVLDTPSGQRIVDIVKCPVYGADGEIDHILSISQDVTEQRRAAEHLRMASRVLEQTGDAVVVSDAVDRIVSVNPAFLQLSALSEAEVMGRNAELVGLPALRESDLPGISGMLTNDGCWHGESRQVCADGRTLETWLSVSTLRNSEGCVTQHIRVFSDISALKAHQRELAEQARHDSLTGLPNRRAFGERLARAMARARRAGAQPLAVLYLDLDGFKSVNDRHGHSAGDRLLVEVARRLLACVRTTDSVCRLAGDEFTVILEGAGTAQDQIRIAERMIQSLSEPHEFDGVAVRCTPSIGIAALEEGESADELCARADAAMYAAKRAGKAQWRLATPYWQELKETA